MGSIDGAGGGRLLPSEPIRRLLLSLWLIRPLGLDMLLERTLPWGPEAALVADGAAGSAGRVGRQYGRPHPGLALAIGLNFGPDFGHGSSRGRQSRGNYSREGNPWESRCLQAVLSCMPVLLATRAAPFAPFHQSTQLTPGAFDDHRNLIARRKLQFLPSCHRRKF